MNPIPTKFTEHQLTEANRRKDLLEAAEALQAKGWSLRQAAEALQVPASNLCRWRKAYGPEKNFNNLVPSVSPGRESVAQKLEKEVGAEQFQKAVEIVQGHHLDMESNRQAWRYCAKTNPAMPEAVAKVVLDENKKSKGNIARSLLALTGIRPSVADANRGPRRLHLLGNSTPRRMDILPGDVWVPDDTTPIWGWWVPWPKSKEYPFGRKVLQGQLLLLVDAASMFRISYCLVARERSSYRACDIWSFFGDVFDDYGLPRLGFQLEGGAWQAKLIRGENVEVRSHELGLLRRGREGLDPQIEYQEGEPSAARRVGALNMLPTRLLPFHYEQAKGEPLPATLKTWRSIRAKTKPVEPAFNLNQKLEGTLWGALGRDQRRRPFEKNQKIFEACQRGTEDPALYFMSWSAIQERLSPLYDYLNWERMEGRVYKGRPVEQWNESIAKYGLTHIPAELRWLYRRDWKVRQLKGAYVDCSFTEESTGEKVSLFYHNDQLFAQHDGETVMVYFDKQNPERPAEIVSTSGQHLGQADCWSGTGTYLNRNEEGFRNHARWASTVMRMTRNIQANSPSHQLPPEIAQHRREARAERVQNIVTERSGEAETSSAQGVVERATALTPAPERKILNDREFYKEMMNH